MIRNDGRMIRVNETENKYISMLRNELELFKNIGVGQQNEILNQINKNNNNSINQSNNQTIQLKNN